MRQSIIDLIAQNIEDSERSDKHLAECEEEEAPRVDQAVVENKNAQCNQGCFNIGERNTEQVRGAHEQVSLDNELLNQAKGLSSNVLNATFVWELNLFIGIVTQTLFTPKHPKVLKRKFTLNILLYFIFVQSNS